MEPQTTFSKIDNTITRTTAKQRRSGGQFRSIKLEKSRLIDVLHQARPVIEKAGITSTIDLRRLARNPEALRKLKLKDEDVKTITQFADLARVFPDDVAVALQEAGVASLAELRKLKPDRFTTVLSRAGLNRSIITRETARYERLRRYLEKGLDPKSISGITIDLGTKNTLPAEDAKKLGRAGIDTLADWVKSRGAIKLTSEGQTTLNAYTRLQAIGVANNEAALLLKAGVQSALDLVQLDHNQRRAIAKRFRIPEAQLLDWQRQAQHVVHRINQRIRQTAVYRDHSLPQWMQSALKFSFNGCDTDVDDASALSKFAYFLYLMRKTQKPLNELEDQMHQEFASITAESDLAPVRQLDVCVDVLKRAFPGSLTHQEKLPAERYMLVRKWAFMPVSLVDFFTILKQRLNLTDASEELSLGYRLEASLAADLLAEQPSFTQDEFSAIYILTEEYLLVRRLEFVPLSPQEFIDEVVANEPSLDHDSLLQRLLDLIAGNPKLSEPTFTPFEFQTLQTLVNINLSDEGNRQIEDVLREVIMKTQLVRREAYKKRSNKTDRELFQQLFIETNLAECEMTTRLDQAIRSLQTYLDHLSNLAQTTEDRENYHYLSYEAWRAERMESYYPELRALWRDDILTGEGNYWDRGSIVANRQVNRRFIEDQLDQVEAVITTARISKGRPFSDFWDDEDRIDNNNDARDFQLTPYFTRFKDGLDLIRSVLQTDDEIQLGASELDKNEPGLALNHFNNALQMLHDIAVQIFEPGSEWIDPNQAEIREYEGLLKLQPQMRSMCLGALAGVLFGEPKKIYTALSASTETVLGSEFFNFDEGEWTSHHQYSPFGPSDLNQKHFITQGLNNSDVIDRIRFLGANSNQLKDYEFTVNIRVMDVRLGPALSNEEQIGIGVRVSGNAGYKLIIKEDSVGLSTGGVVYRTFLILYKLDSSGNESEKARDEAYLPFALDENYTFSLGVETDQDNPNTAHVYGKVAGNGVSREVTFIDTSAFTQGTFALYCSQTVEAEFRPNDWMRVSTPSEQQSTPPFYAPRRSSDNVAIHRLPEGQAIFHNHIQSSTGMATELLPDLLIEKATHVVTTPLNGLKAPYGGSENELYLLFKKGEFALKAESLDALDLLLERCLALTFYMRYAVLPVRMAQAYFQSGDYARAIDMLHLLYDESAKYQPSFPYVEDLRIVYPLSLAPIGYATTVSSDVSLLRLRLAEVYLAWADWEFRRNTEESRYRARLYYDTVLALHEDPGYCACEEPIGRIFDFFPQWLAEDNADDESVETMISIAEELNLSRNYPVDWDSLLNKLLSSEEPNNTSNREGLRLIEETLVEADSLQHKRLREHTSLKKLQEQGQAIIKEAELQTVADTASHIFAMTQRREQPLIRGENPWTSAVLEDFSDLIASPAEDEEDNFEIVILTPIWISLITLSIPPNPLRSQQKQQACFMLDLLRTCRNILGYTDAVVPPLRFEALLRLARFFTDQALAAERDLLNFRQSYEQEAFSLAQANNNLVLSDQELVLETLGIEQATNDIRLAQLQRRQALNSMSHYETLIREGWTVAEHIAFWSSAAATGVLFLNALPALAAAGLSVTSAGASLLGMAGIGSGVLAPAGATLTAAGVLGTLAGAAGAIAGGGGAIASGLGSLSSTASMYASFERRDQEWRYQLGQSRISVAIAMENVRQANARFQISLQRRNIALLKRNFAVDTVAFLNHKFLNANMWVWMVRMIREEYRTRLNYAIAAAYMAERALVFELQDHALRVIRFDYFDVQRDGMLGATQLQTDLTTLQNIKLERTQRKLQLSKIFSLAHLSPLEFARFKQTGCLTFRSMLEQFDRDYPGHYMRLIKNVRVSVLALVPPNQGIRATLHNSGISKVVTGPPFAEKEVRRDPESVALSSPYAATGLFVLDYKDDSLLPFEGNGVETDWIFEMPKAANPFEYTTIADVLLEIEYTALSNEAYRWQVQQRLDRSFSADQAFSLRYNFADAWYHLQNPIADAHQALAQFTIRPEDFVPNLQNLTIDHVNLYIVSKDGTTFNEDVQLLFAENSHIWTDYQLSVAMTSDDDGAIGIIFRVQDSHNYYRFAWNKAHSYRRLVKQVDGVFETLYEDDVPYEQGQTYQLHIRVQGSEIEIRIDGTLICKVFDSSLAYGSIALYSSENQGSHFEQITVADMFGLTLLEETFQNTNLAGWQIVDEGSQAGPSNWSIVSGRLTQHSNIHSTGTNELGTYLLWSLWSTGGSATPTEGLISTHQGYVPNWQALLGKTPFGEWLLTLRNTEALRDLFKQGKIEDILLVITHSGITPEWP